jgi:hypothetical protein
MLKLDRWRQHGRLSSCDVVVALAHGHTLAAEMHPIDQMLDGHQLLRFKSVNSPA